MTHKEYLENILQSRKLELRELNVQYRIAIAEHDKEKELLNKQIDSIEAQLREGE